MLIYLVAKYTTMATFQFIFKGILLATFGLLMTICLPACSKGGNSPDDNCANVTCSNGVSCNNGSCDCEVAGYNNPSCDTESRTRYYGNYNTYTDCSNNYVITIGPSNKGLFYVDIANIDGEGNNVFGQFSFTQPYLITIPTQVVGIYTFDGTIQYTSGYFTADLYFYRAGPPYYACSGAITKQ